MTMNDRNNSLTCLCLFCRLTALRALFQSLVQGEDIIKVHEARLTEKDTSSLDLNENEEYCATLKVRSQLEYPLKYQSVHVFMCPIYEQIQGKFLE